MGGVTPTVCGRVRPGRRTETIVKGLGAQLQLAADGFVQPLGPGPRPARVAAGVHHEVAVRAASHAERQMNVQRDGRQERAHKERLARSRWRLARGSPGGGSPRP
jgi:hypothetical protein